MLGFFFIYFVGSIFYRLATRYQKPGWLYGLIGILVFYAGIVLSDIILFTLYWNPRASSNTFYIDLISILVGVAISYLLYDVLSHNFKQSFHHQESNTLDEDFLH